jgi:hypothetical protein
MRAIRTRQVAGHTQTSGIHVSKQAAESLHQRGFAVVPMLHTQSEILMRAVDAFDVQFPQSSRFPPVGKEPPPFNSSLKAAFSLMFHLALENLQGVSAFYLDSTRRDDLQCLPPIEPWLSFDPFLECNHPFAGRAGKEQMIPFRSSFFNVFNRGSLNVHKDRCLLTVIWGTHNQTGSGQCESEGSCGTYLAGQSRLWVQDAQFKTWVDAQHEVEVAARAMGSNDGLIVFAGEELEEMSYGFFPAAQHCVRVDPDGEYLHRSHHQPDPASAARANRRSVALVLSHSS